MIKDSVKSEPKEWKGESIPEETGVKKIIQREEAIRCITS
jgi:hypothetical protein